MKSRLGTDVATPSHSSLNATLARRPAGSSAQGSGGPTPMAAAPNVVSQ